MEEGDPSETGRRTEPRPGSAVTTTERRVKEGASDAARVRELLARVAQLEEQTKATVRRALKAPRRRGDRRKSTRAPTQEQPPAEIFGRLHDDAGRRRMERERAEEAALLERQLVESAGCTFAPRIGQVTRVLAERGRSRSSRKVHRRRVAEEMAREREEREMRECTFQPNVTAHVVKAPASGCGGQCK